MLALLADILDRDPVLAVACALGLICLILVLILMCVLRALSRVRADVGHMRKDMDARNILLDKGRQAYKEALARQPDVALKIASRSSHDGDRVASNRVLAKWVAEQGDPVARVLLERAKWAYVHARGAIRHTALSGAEGYAAAAVALSPKNRDAVGFYNELRGFRKEDSRPLTPLSAALIELENLALEPGSAFDLFENDLEMSAADAEREANKQYETGHYHLALASIDAALRIRMKTDGADAIRTLSAQSLKGYILLGLERSEEALPILTSVAERMVESPDYGPSHPDTLACRYQLALVLDNLGRSRDALPILRDVIQKQERSPVLGPNHPDTLESQHFLQALYDRGIE
jgi:hypothetical protein